MRKLCFILVPLLFVACTDSQPVAPDVEVTPNFGATVYNEIEYWHPLRITWMDNQPPDEWDVLLLGYDTADDPWCNDWEFVGGIPVRHRVTVTRAGDDFEPLPPWNETWGFGERIHEVANTIGRPPLYLYLRSDFPPPEATADEWCNFVKYGWIAAGNWSARIYGDNDLTGGDDTPGNNSFGGTETGRLVGTDGTRYKYSWKWRGHYTPEDGFRLVHSVDMVERK